MLIVGQLTFEFLESWSRTFLAIATAMSVYALFFIGPATNLLEIALTMKKQP